MLQTSGQATSENEVFNADAVAFRWEKKSFVADTSLPLDDLLKEVGFVSIVVPENVASRVDELIKEIVDNDKKMTELDETNKKNKVELDEILSTKVKATRKSNKLMDYLRDKWNVSMLPFKTVLMGTKYKATKSRGSSSDKPDYEKIVTELKTRFPKLVKDIEKIETEKRKVTNTASGWKNFSEITPSKN